jgi:hypothetical protein
LTHRRSQGKINSQGGKLVPTGAAGRAVSEINVGCRGPVNRSVRHRSKMNESSSQEVFEFVVQAPDQQKLIDRILETGDGGHSVHLFGLPGYIFPESHDMRMGGICVKSRLDDDHQIRVNLSYRFRGDKLQVYNIHTWGGIDIGYVVSMLRSGIAEMLG